ncbi:MAG: hypothetical protein OXF84_10395 [Bacteroidetes bacterium]|nr:hypothetical protein [Bacteroidota bacterium]
MIPQDVEKVCKTKVELLAALQDVEVSDEVWIELSNIVGKFFAQRATLKANQVVDKEAWTEDDFHRLVHTHMRTPYRP